MVIESIVFGPVPSRRLGYSLGVNNVFDKYCSYSCIYCQAGHTTRLIIKRRAFYDPLHLVDEVVKASKKSNPDIISFVPNGEPTLDINLGFEARLVKKKTGKPIAIFTNASLINHEDIVDELMVFDVISVKVDTVYTNTWKKLNRPHPALVLDEILDGIREFSKKYNGKLLTETMLVADINDNIDEYRGIAEYLKTIRLNKAYIQIPIRPPAEKWVKPPSEERILEAYNIFVENLGEDKVELLTAPEPGKFRFSSNLVEDIAKTIYVHPVRIDYVYEIASSRGINPEEIIDELINKGYAVIIEYMGKKFLVAKTHTRLK